VTMLIERDAADLDLATNLSDDIHEVFGFTQFERGQKPVVKIARELWEQRHRNNRLRTTLTHEYGHVMLTRGCTTSTALPEVPTAVTGRACCLQ
ncbi:MAG: hypothetical protein IVW56_08650, partial [Candidatus Binataceae bacterium]|nr:hypothetical protein [Candidatus Binataceae bacterium]